MNIVTNPKIKKALFDRWEHLGLRVSHVIQDANERGMKITAGRMSRYKTGSSKEMISATQLLWLCTRYGIFININIGKPKVINGKLEYVIPPYNELECLDKLKKVFGNNGEKEKNKEAEG